MVPAPPQVQPYKAEPTFVAKTAVVPALASGINVTNLVSIFPSLKPWAVTLIIPAASVTTAATYLVVALALEVPAPASQPQPFAPGGDDALPDWYSSVIEVRQAEAAKTTSDNFARFV